MNLGFLGAWGNKCVLESVVVTNPVHESTKITVISFKRADGAVYKLCLKRVLLIKPGVRGWKPCERCVVTDT